MKIFITGATGFVGLELIRSGMALAEHELKLLARDNSRIPEELKHLAWHIGDIMSLTDEDLQGVDVVIHAAAKAHDANAPESEYIINNTEATRHLADCAGRAGVRRFIFISTIKVHGEYTLPNQPFQLGDKPNPRDIYSLTKLQSEQSVQKIAAEHEMDWVIIRPPLLYGRQMKGNLQKLAKLIKNKMPLPFGAVENKRSVLAVSNLVDAIWRMLTTEYASRQIFLISDGEPISTPQLVRYIAKAIDVEPKLIAVPPLLLKIGCRLLGRQDVYVRTCLSLHLDDSHIRKQLNWSPAFTTMEAMQTAIK